MRPLVSARRRRVNRHALVLVLIGVSGSGKSTIGRKLAALLGASFIEGDTFHPAANIKKMREGHPLSDQDRWPWLGRLGHAIGRQARDGRNVVVACSALRRTYRRALADAAHRPLVFIALAVPQTVLAQRIGARHHFMPLRLLTSQLATFEALSPDEPGFTVVATPNVFATIERIRRALKQIPPKWTPVRR